MTFDDSIGTILSQCMPDGRSAGLTVPDILSVVELLADRHDMTLAEAADVIAEWEAGLLGTATAA